MHQNDFEYLLIIVWVCLGLLIIVLLFHCTDEI